MRSLAFVFLSAIPLAVLDIATPAFCEPVFSTPDMAVIFNRIAPHFTECAGSPVPGMIKGDGTYRNDGFYVGKPEMVMPTGSGTLSAMVSYGDRLELHLSKTGYYNALSDDESGAKGAHVNPLLSPGHISIELPNASAKQIIKLDQRIDFARGSVIVELQTAEGSVRIEVAGDMNQDNLVISIKDARHIGKPASIRYDNWRNSMMVKDGEGMLMGEEAADVSGIQGPKAQSVSMAIQIGCMNGEGYKTTSYKNSGSLIVPASVLDDFTVIISAKCAHGKPPVEMTRGNQAEFPR